MQRSSEQVLAWIHSYRTQGHWLRRTIKRFHFPVQVEEDLLQEAFLRYFLSLSQVEPGKERGFLACTLRNLAIDYLRRQKTQKIDFVGELLGNEDHDAQAAEYDGRRASTDKLAELLPALCGEILADTLHLYYGEGLSLVEIAQLTGLSVSTISSRLSRARRRYRTQIMRYLGEESLCL